MNTSRLKILTHKNQSGQSLVEFVLLLTAILIISMGFLKSVNSGMGNQWKAMATILLEDPNQKIEFR
jgi:hypothetical protein